MSKIAIVNDRNRGGITDMVTENLDRQVREFRAKHNKEGTINLHIISFVDRA